MSNIEESIILIVDDTPENIDVLNEVLKGYKRKIATSGERALKIANSDNPPDLILLDIMMPEMDGFEVCRRLKENPKTRDIVVIFITAKNSIEDETHGLKLGAVDFISKPISPPSVQARVKNHLELISVQKKLLENNLALKERNKYITDSIRYAETIQRSILKEDKQLKKIFPKSFLIFMPKDIVSGDFYWVAENGNKKIVAVVDCTGHGVPGAFMSMIGNTKLNEIILEKKILEPDEILNQLNQSIIDELHKDIHKESFDGMDVALCVIDESEKTISYSGAYRPLYIYQNSELNIIKGNRKSIGEVKKETKFTTTEIKYNSDTRLFMFSDGLPDQNNSEQIKFGRKRIREIISGHSGSGIQNLHEILKENIRQHKGEEIQRDDITFIGIELD